MRPLHLTPPSIILIALALPLPMLAASADGQIEASITSSYNFKTYLREDTIKVACSAGVVTLTGNVSQDYHKALAQETAIEQAGVKRVNNQVVVTGVQPPEHSDAWISMKVRTALAFHKNVSATDTDVKTLNGSVTLTGRAGSSAQKELTGEYAKDVDGVTEVYNDLTVVSPKPGAAESVTERVDDASITAQIKTTLLFRKSTHALTTKVVTRDGVVSLSGEARNGAEKDLAGKLAEDIKGVKQVNNHMTILPS